MKKIANPQELIAELNSLLAYSQTKNPSREKLASDMRDLADRVAGKVPPQFLEQQKKMKEKAEKGKEDKEKKDKDKD